jgi:hypothetical protein
MCLMVHGTFDRMVPAGVNVEHVHCHQVPDRCAAERLTARADHNWHAHPAGAWGCSCTASSHIFAPTLRTCHVLCYCAVVQTWCTGVQDCMVGLLFAFMPVLGHKRGAEMEDGLVARLLFRCGPMVVMRDAASRINSCCPG